MASLRHDSLASRVALLALALGAVLALLAPASARGEGSPGLRDAAATSPGQGNDSGAAAPSLPDLSMPSRDDVERWLHDPFHVAIVVGVGVFLLLLFGGLVLHLRPLRDAPAVEPEPESPRDRSGATGRALIAGALASIVVFAALAAAVWTRSEAAVRTVPAGFTQSGAFTYRADAPVGAAYPAGLVTTGDPIFRRLVDRVRFDFEYRLASANPTKIRGAIGLDLLLSDPSTGWTRRLALARPAPFVGDHASTTGVVDLAELTRMQQLYRRSTGAPATNASVAIVPTVDVSGYSGETVIDGPFAPALRLDLDPVALVPTGGAAALAPAIAATTSVQVPARLQLRGHGLDVTEARAAAVLGLVTSLVVLLAGMALLAFRRRPSDRERIALRFGSRLVAAREAPSDGRWVTDVSSIDELARVAETYDRVVVRVAQGSLDAYYVDDGVALYRFVHASQGHAVVAQPVPVGSG